MANGFPSNADWKVRKKTFEPNGALDSATPKPKSHECETCIMRYYTICPREFIGKTVWKLESHEPKTNRK